MESDESWIWDFKTNVVLDFSGLDSEYKKTFYAELILNYIWAELQLRPRRCVIAVDEAHRIMKPESLLNEMAREIRSLGGALLVATQNFTDIDEKLLNQFDTQFVFKTTNHFPLSASFKS